MGTPDERHHVMLAMGVELDIAEHDQIVIAADFLEGAGQRLDGILLISLKNSR